MTYRVVTPDFFVRAPARSDMTAEEILGAFVMAALVAIDPCRRPRPAWPQVERDLFRLLNPGVSLPWWLWP